MERLLNRGTAAVKAKMLPVPVKFDMDEPMKAWSKIDRTLNSAQTDVHVEAAQIMFNKMLDYYGFTKEQRNSPLIHGMQGKINSTRKNVVVTRK